MKKIAIIGASYLQAPLVQKAKSMGLFSICFAWRDGAVCADLCDRFYPISIIEKEAILNICRLEGIDGICTIASDVAAPTVAYVANALGLVGNDYDAAVRANNKYLMRESFRKSGVLSPKYIMVSEHDITDSFYSELQKIADFPLIVKPSDRSGSLGVTKVKTVAELKVAVEKAASFSFKHEVMIEEFIEGKEISVEFISYKGEHYPLQITDKITTDAPYFVELAHHQPSNLSLEKYSEIYEITRSALDSLGVTDGASHSEYKITDSGRVYVMEIGARMGGDFIGSDLVPLSIGFDFVKGVIDVALGQFVPPKKTISKYSGVYFLCKETEWLLPYFKRSDIMDFVVRQEINDCEIRSVSCSADRSGYLIYQSDKKLVLPK